MYKKRWNLTELIKILKELQKDKKFVDLEDLYYQFGFDTLDVNELYITHIRHSIRYDREADR